MAQKLRHPFAVGRAPIWAKTNIEGVDQSAASVTSGQTLTDVFAYEAGTAGQSEIVVKVLGIAV